MRRPLLIELVLACLLGLACTTPRDTGGRGVRPGDAAADTRPDGTAADGARDAASDAGPADVPPAGTGDAAPAADAPPLGADGPPDAPVSPPDVGPAPLQVTAVSPPAAATGASPAGAVSATFSAMVDPATAMAFVVKRGATTVEGTVSVAGNVVTFQPARPLVLASGYQVVVPGSVKDLAGTALGADYSWAFTVRDGVFGTSQAISAIGQNAQTPVLAINGNGEAMAAWTQTTGLMHTKVFAARYAPASGWFAPAVVDTAPEAISSGGPDVAISDDGTALAVFSDPTNQAGSYSRFSNGWSPTAPFAQYTLHQSVAMDAAGKGVCVYEGAGPVEARNFAAATAWSGEQMLSGSAIFPRVAMAPGGTGVAALTAFEGGGMRIYTARYDGTAWLTAVPLSGLSASDFPDVAVDSSATPWVLWVENDQTYSSRFTAGAWVPPQMVGPGLGGSAIAFSREPTDNLAAVMSSLGAPPGQVWANVESGGSWHTAAKLSTRDDAVVDFPSIAMAPNGNAIAVWAQAGSVWVARYTEGANWAPAVPLPDATGMVFAPLVRIDRSGRALVTYQRQDGMVGQVSAFRFE